jgi:hypothetical protein
MCPDAQSTDIPCCTRVNCFARQLQTFQLTQIAETTLQVHALPEQFDL